MEHLPNMLIRSVTELNRALTTLLVCEQKPYISCMIFSRIFMLAGISVNMQALDSCKGTFHARQRYINRPVYISYRGCWKHYTLRNLTALLCLALLCCACSLAAIQLCPCTALKPKRGDSWQLFVRSYFSIVSCTLFRLFFCPFFCRKLISVAVELLVFFFLRHLDCSFSCEDLIHCHLK